MRRTKARLRGAVGVLALAASVGACSRPKDAPSTLRLSATADLSRGRNLLASDEPAAASRHLFRALAAFRDVGDVEGEAASLAALGRARLGEQRYALAVRFFEKAMALRGDALASIRLAASYGETLLALGRHEAAIDWLSHRLSAGTCEPECGRLWLVLSRARRAAGRLRPALAAVENEQALHASLEGRRLLVDILFELGELERAFEASQEVSLAEVQRELLQPGSRALAYTLLEDQSLLWDVTPSQLTAHPLAAERVLDSLARTARDELASGGSHHSNGALARLSRELLGTVRLSSADQRLVVVSDGALASVPFSALALSGETLPLLNRVEIVRVSSLAALAELRARPGRGHAGWVGVAADPSYGLSGARREARAIEQLAPPGAVEVVRGSEASSDVVLGSAFRSFRVLHLATHGVEDGGLVLSDRVVGRSELREAELLAETIVLSACATDLAGAFLENGARQVIASHWSVDDVATAELMSHFYRALFNGARPGAALREAQVSLSRDPRFRSPRYWSAFELHGDWAL